MIQFMHVTAHDITFSSFQLTFIILSQNILIIKLLILNVEDMFIFKNISKHSYY